MATRTAQAITTAGTALTSYSAAAGDKIVPDDNLFLIITNADSSPHDLTIAVPGTNAYGEANPDPVRTIANATPQGVKLLREWADPSDGLIALTWSSTTSMSYYVVRG